MSLHESLMSVFFHLYERITSICLGIYFIRTINCFRLGSVCMDTIHGVCRWTVNFLSASSFWGALKTERHVHTDRQIVSTVPSHHQMKTVKCLKYVMMVAGILSALCLGSIKITTDKDNIENNRPKLLSFRFGNIYLHSGIKL